MLLLSILSKKLVGKLNELLLVLVVSLLVEVVVLLLILDSIVEVLLSHISQTVLTKSKSVVDIVLLEVLEDSVEETNSLVKKTTVSVADGVLHEQNDRLLTVDARRHNVAIKSESAVKESFKDSTSLCQVGGETSMKESTVQTVNALNSVTALESETLVLDGSLVVMELGDDSRENEHTE